MISLVKDDQNSKYLQGLAQRIKELREKEGMSQEALARAIETKSSSDVSRWERALVSPSALNLERLSRVLKVSIDYLVKGEPGGSAPVVAERLNSFLKTSFGQEALKRGWLDQLRRLNPPEGAEDAMYRALVLLLLERASRADVSS